MAAGLIPVMPVLVALVAGIHVLLDD